ncbi:hypothetical protein HDU98_011774 [Podochytrium sp. JEL0797]|nr:hypothetical protein HDU98_011774 [Podochytrium sp. JEL0797]
MSPGSEAGASLAASQSGMVASHESLFEDGEPRLSPRSAARQLMLKGSVSPSRRSPTRSSVAGSPKLSSKSLNSESTTLAHLIATLESQLAESKSQHALDHETIMSLENACAQATSLSESVAVQNQQLLSDVEASKQNALALNAQIRALESSLAAANASVKTVDPSSSSAAMTELSTQLATKTEELESTTSLLHQTQLDLEMIQRERAQFLDEVSSKSGEIGALTAQIEQLEQSVESGAEVLERLEVSERVASELKAVKVGLEARVKDLESAVAASIQPSTVSTLESEITTLRNQIAESRSPNTHQLPAPAAATAELESLHTQVSELTQQVRVVSQEAESERLRCLTLQTTITSLQARLNTPESPSTSAEFNHLKNELTRLNNLHDAEMTRFTTKSQALETEIAALKEYLHASEENNTELREQIDGLEEVIQRSAGVSPVAARGLSPSADGEVERLRNELGSLNHLFEEESGRLETEVRELKRYLKAAEEENGELREQVEVLEEQLTSGVGSGAAQQVDTTQVDELKRYLKAAEEENGELREQVEVLEGKLQQQSLVVGSGAASESQSRFVSATTAPDPVSFTEEWDSWDEPADPIPAPLPADSSHIQTLELQITTLTSEKISALESLTQSLEENARLTTRIANVESHLDTLTLEKVTTLEQLTAALQDCDTLASELRTIGVERDTVNQKLSVLHADAERMHNQVASLTTERDDAVAALSSGSSDVHQLLESTQSKLAAIVTERDRHVEATTALKDEVALLKSEAVKLVSLQSELDASRIQCGDLEEELEAAKERLDSLLEENDSLQEQLEDSRGVRIDAEESLHVLKRDHDALLIEHEQALGEKEMMGSVNADLKSQNQSMVIVAEQVHAEHRDLAARYEELLIQLEEANEQNERMRDAGAEVIALRSSLEEENADLAEQLDTLREAGAKLVQDRQALEEEADALAGQVDELTLQLQTVSEEKASLEALVGETRTELDARLHVLQEAESRATRFERLFREVESKSANDANELVDTLRNLTEENSDLKHAVQEGVDSCNALRFEIESLAVVKNELLAKQGSLEHELEGKADELLHVSGQVASLETELQNLHATVEQMGQLEAERDLFQQQLHEAESHNAATMETIHQLESERDHLNQQLRETESHLSTTTETIHHLETERDALSQQITELQQSAPVMDELEALRADLADSEARFDQLFTDGEAHTLGLESQLQEASQAIEQLTAERGQLHYEIDFLKERLSAEEEFAVSEQKAKDALRVELVQLKESHDGVMERMHTVEADLVSNEEVLDRVTAKLGATEEQVSSLTDELERLQGERDRLIDANATLQGQMDEFMAEKDGLTAAAHELATLRGVVDDLERENKSVSEQYQHLQHALDACHVSQAGVERELEGCMGEKQQLLQELDTTRRDCEEYQHQAVELRSAISMLEHERDAVVSQADELRVALETAQSDSTLKESEKEAIRAQCEQSVAQFYEQEIAQLKEQLQVLEDQHASDLEVRAQQYSDKLAQLDGENRREVERLEELVNQATREAQEFEHQVSNLSHQLQDSESRISNLQAQCDDSATRAASSESAAHNLNESIARVSAERDEFQHQFLEGAQLLESLKANLETNESQLNALVAEKEAAVQELQQALEESYQLVRDKEGELVYEKQSWENRCGELEAQWRSVQAELEGVVSQYAESQRAIESVSFQLEEAAIKLDASEQERLLTSTERDSLTRQLAELHTIESSQLAELEDLRLRTAQAEDRVKTLEQLVDSLESQRSQFNAVIHNETALMQQISNKQQVIESLERELVQLKSTNVSPKIGYGGVPTADSLFGGSSSAGGVGSRSVTVDNELSLLKLELRNKEDELASVHESYKKMVAEMDEKLGNCVKLNKSSVQSMELYRDELVKKTDRLEVVEEELFRVKTNVAGAFKETPDTSMLDISKYEDALDRAGKTSKTLDQLLSATARGTADAPSLGRVEKVEILDILTSQIGTLLKSTETNASISRQILNQVSSSGSPIRGSAPRDDGQMKLIVQSQSSILDDHKRLLNDVEVLARLFRETGSPRKASFPLATEDVSVEVIALVSKFVDKVDEYQKSVSGFAVTKQAVLQDLRSSNSQSKTVLSSLNILISGLEDVETQNIMLKKEIGYLGALVSKISGSNTTPSSVVDVNKKPESGSQDYRLSTREYSSLVTKVKQSERYQQQAENAQTLLAEHVREIQILKESLQSMSATISRDIGPSGVNDVQTFRAMTRQIDELKKVWSHELSANMILRNLIAKTQAESMVAEQEARKQEASLREEFDELAVLFEETQLEADTLRAEVDKKDEMVRAAGVRAEEQFNSRFFEMEQQHIEQSQTLEDMYDKERVALNKLVSNLEKERNRLLVEVTSLKDQSKETKGAGGRREQELVADIQALERQLHDERKVHERRMMDREAEWKRIREEDMKRRGTMNEYPNDRLDDAQRVFRSQKEHLEHDLMLRDGQIHTLEVRIQELLQEAEAPRRSGGNRREMEMERDLQASFNQIRDLKNQLATVDHDRQELEAQFAMEKDRCKRLSAKADDLKRRYQYQQRLLEDHEESINSALRPAPRGGNAEEQLRDEIDHLRRELHNVKQSRNDILNVIRETMINTVGEVSFDAIPSSATSASSMHRDSQRIDMSRLRSQMSSLIAEVIYLRALANRLFLWRADLKYQKVYLALKVADLSESQRATVKFIREIGVDAPPNELDAPVLRPIQKFKAGVNVVIGVYRMMVMARQWQDTLEDNNRDYMAIAPVPMPFHDVEDEGMLTDVSTRSMTQTPYGGSSQMLGHANDGYSRNGARQSQVLRYPSQGDMYASDASEMSVGGGRQKFSSSQHDLESRRLRGRSAYGVAPMQPQYQQGPPLPHMQQRGDPRWMVPGGVAPAGMAKNGSQPDFRRSIGSRR